MNKLFKNGSKWVRFDCHLHTNADKEFKVINENSYFDDYVNKLKSEDIRVGIITNHNKFDFDEYKTLSKKAIKEDIFLLPGIELSVCDGANGVHTIIVFNPDEWLTNKEQIDYIKQFIVSTFSGIAGYENENGRSNDNLLNTIKKLDDFYKDYFIIFAHVEGKSGFFEEFNGGRIKEIGKNKFFRNRLLGFQKVITRDKVEKWKIWLDNNLPAFVEGSDPKSVDEIGKGKHSYIKIGDFNFEAVKYALKAKDIRVSAKKKEIQNAYIKNISFEGGRFDGQIINFSNSMNNFIGIRGSGKSSVIEAIRYVLDIPFGLKTADINYKNDLVKALMGSGGKITIEAVDKNKNNYTISKIYGHSSEIKRDGKIISVDVKEMLGKPLYFGQKDLSNTGSGFEEDLLNKLIGDKTKEISNQISTKQQEVRLAIENLKIYDSLKNQKEQSITKIKELELKKEDFKKYDLEEKLQKQTIFEKDRLNIKKIKEKLKNYCTEIDSFIASTTNYFSVNFDYKSNHNQDIFDEIKALFQEMNTSLNKVTKELNSIKNKTKDIEKMEQKFNIRFKSLQDEFAKIQREINIPNLRADDYLNIEKSLQAENLKLAAFDDKQKKQIELFSKKNELISELNDLYHKEFQSIKEYIDTINNSQEFIKIEIGFKENKEVFKEFLKSIFSGTGLWADDYEFLIQNTDMHEIDKKMSEIKDKFSANKFASFYERFQNSLAQCLTFQVPNKITIKYKDKELCRHSLGQRASALIIFILTQKDSDIIIIDQPEDDLDNQTIYNEVIKELLKLKDKTQFIFATHNANIPVLGDSEQVVVCEFDNEKIMTQSGSIDGHFIQEKIVSIMEGGNEAFTKRKEIYNLWKQ